MDLHRERFRTSTRGRVVALLREGEKTVEELAAALELTDNAVRAHLVALERDGVARAAGTRRIGPGKPAVLYVLVAEAEVALSQAYAPMLTALLDVMRERLPPTVLRSILRRTGRLLAGKAEPSRGTLRERAVDGVAVIERLGGSASVEVLDDHVAIQGNGCPLGAVVRRHDDACLAITTLLGTVTSTAVRSRCDRGDRPVCRFEMRESGARDS